MPHQDPSPRFIHDGKLYHYQGSIFDKLTDPSLFTGTHKLRFDAHGRGRGVYGRDSHSVHVQETRNGYGDDKEGFRWSRGLRTGMHHPSTTQRPTYKQRSSSSFQDGFGGDLDAQSTLDHRSVSDAAHLEDLDDENEEHFDSKAIPATRFTAFVMDAEGHMIKDERRTHMMMYGPNSRRAMPQDVEEAEWRGSNERRSVEVDPNVWQADPHGAQRGYGPSFSPERAAVEQGEASGTGPRYHTKGFTPNNVRNDRDLEESFNARATPRNRPVDTEVRTRTTPVGSSGRAFPHHEATYTDDYVRADRADLYPNAKPPRRSNSRDRGYVPRANAHRQAYRRVQPWERVMIENNDNNRDLADYQRGWSEERPWDEDAEIGHRGGAQHRRSPPSRQQHRDAETATQLFYNDNNFQHQRGLDSNGFIMGDASPSRSTPPPPPAANAHQMHTVNTAESYASKLRDFLHDDPPLPGGQGSHHPKRAGHHNTEQLPSSAVEPQRYQRRMMSEYTDQRNQQLSAQRERERGHHFIADNAAEPRRQQPEDSYGHTIHNDGRGSQGTPINKPPSLEETLQLVQRYEQFHAGGGTSRPAGGHHSMLQ